MGLDYIGNQGAISMASNRVLLTPDPDVLNGINWSGDLDEVFKKNRQEYPGIYWQSFGSRNGYLRVYPAAK